MKAKQEAAGCLPSFLRWFGTRSSATGGKKPADLPYRRRDDFLSPAERSFFGVLQQVIGDRGVLLAKVRLADLLFVPKGDGDTGFRNRISLKHVDFVLCHPKTIQPLAAIELDDSSHSTAKQQEKDQFQDEAFAAAELPLLRFTARRQYDPRQIATRLEPLLTGPAQLAPPVIQSEHTTDQPPRCPKCDTQMVLRTASRGASKGSQFYACPNFPQCRTTQPVAD